MSVRHMQNAAVQAAGLSLSQLEASKYVFFASILIVTSASPERLDT